MSRVYCPSSAPVLNVETLSRWFANVLVELDETSLSAVVKNSLTDYYEEAGLLRKSKQRFFFAHHVEPVAAAMKFLFAGATRPRVLDLGCGVGTQSLLLALLGARVVAMDLSERAGEVLVARKAWYERELHVKLDIDVVIGDAREIDWNDLGVFNGLWSSFAFNMIQPSGQLLDRLISAMTRGSRFAIFDGNWSHWWLSHTQRQSRPLTPTELAAELRERGLVVRQHIPGITFPPIVWRLLPPSTLHRVQRSLPRQWKLPVSHLVLAEVDDLRR